MTEIQTYVSHLRDKNNAEGEYATAYYFYLLNNRAGKPRLQAYMVSHQRAQEIIRDVKAIYDRAHP